MTQSSNRPLIAYYHLYKIHEPYIPGTGAMHGARRVVIFCLLTAVLPTVLLIIPLYLRQSLFADVIYPVAESDILEIKDGISTIFCQGHTLKMNLSFNAYQVEKDPEIGHIRKHIRLRKNMSLPDDTLEYWGFFLPKGSTMDLTVCSKLEGARILVVKGDKNLNTCGLLDHSKNKKMNSLSRAVNSNQDKVRVTFESDAREIYSNESDIMFSTYKKENKNIKLRKSRSLGDKINDLEYNDSREVEDSDGIKAFFFFKEVARKYLNKSRGDVNNLNLRTFEETIIGHKLRHAKQKSGLKELKNFHLSNVNIEEKIRTMELEGRKRRNVVSKSPHNLDIAKIAHGGNFVNFTKDESSVSSFENSLLNCYDGQILLNHMVPSSNLCVKNSFLFSSGAKKMTTTHDVTYDGYYYYIFYSDKDDVLNDIYATFDIFKPTYQYVNYSKNCMNQTECTFSLKFFSNERVIVEVPTRNGIEHEDDDITNLLSICLPRMSVYIIFPILVLFLILGCAFL